VLNAAWILGVALTIQSTPAPAPPSPPAPPPDDTQIVGHVARDLGHNVRSLPRLESAAIVGAGLAGTRLAHSVDNRLTGWVREQGSSLSYTPIGGLLGNAWMQGGAAIATYAIGAVQHSPEVEHIGRDLVGAQLLNGVLTLGIKVSIDRTRPDGGARSFPSGHTSSSFASATVLADHYGWKVAVPAYAFATFVGWTRVRDQQHWASDVVFGSAVGILAGRTATLHHGRGSWMVVPVAAPGGAAVYFVRMGQ